MDATRYRVSIPTGPHSTHILYRADAAELNRALQFHARRDTWVRIETYHDTEPTRLQLAMEEDRRRW